MRQLNINTLKKHNQKYFQKGNKKFFGDISYTFLEHKNQRYLLTHTYDWSDMFGQPKKDFYTLKSVDNDLKISSESKIFENNPFE